MLRRVALVRTDVSEELSASIIMTTIIGRLETVLAVTGNRSTLRKFTNSFQPDDVGDASSETSVHTRATLRLIIENDIFHSHRRENLKSYIALTGWALWRRRNVSPVRYELGSYTQEDNILHSHLRENLKSYIALTAWAL
jgi:hypothetical protein